ncbi:hypothetical protein Tco_0813451 [Tanacetum coccineum]
MNLGMQKLWNYQSLDTFLKYTITSRSRLVVAMALHLVLRVEKKIHVIEQPLPPAPEPVAEPNVVAQWTALYDAHTEIACLMLGS